jgi:predicted TIM-barrel fold metal-dependent hydrolase
MTAAGPIDVQTHFLPPTMVDALARRTEIPRLEGELVVYGDGAAYPLLPSMTDLDRKLAEMDEAGLGMSILSVNIPGLDWFDAADAPAIARAVNDELAEAVAAHPDRLGAFAALPMQVPEQAAEELDRAMRRGLQGTMLYSNVAGRSLDEPAFRPVFATAAALDAPILLHPTYPLSAASVRVHALLPVIGFLFDTTTATLRLILDGLFDRHPDLTLILGHAGSVIPFILGRIDYESSRIPGGLGALQTLPSEHVRRLYVDTVSGWPPALELVIDLLGAERVLYATDHPFWDPARTREAMAAVDLPPDRRALIERGNAERLLPLAERRHHASHP